MASASVTSPQSLNRYTYVQNNPTNFTDPTGLMLSDIGVYQTDNEAEARFLDRKMVDDFRRAISPPDSMPIPFIDTPENHMDGPSGVSGQSNTGDGSVPQNSQSGSKVVFDAVELLDDSGAGLPQKGPLRVLKPINPIRSATREELNPNAFTLNVDDPRVAVDGLIAIRVKFNVVDGDQDSVNVITTTKENRRWDIAESREIDHNSFIVGVNVYDKEAPVNPIYVNVAVSWRAAWWEQNKLNDVRHKTARASIRLIIGPKDR